MSKKNAITLLEVMLENMQEDHNKVADLVDLKKKDPESHPEFSADELQDALKASEENMQNCQDAIQWCKSKTAF